MPARPHRLVEPSDMDDAIRRYFAGEGSIVKIAASVGISNSAFKTELRRRHLVPRARSEAQRQRYVRDADTPWAQKFKASAARSRAAWVNSDSNRERFRHLGLTAGERNRGTIASADRLARRANTHQRLTLKVSPAALTLRQWIEDRGIETTLEAACGRYNIDIGIAPVAVEVHPYSFNPLGPTRARERQRTRYLCDRGWLVLYVWISARSYTLDEAAADYVVSLVKSAQSDPTLIGQYRVIRGTGEFVAGGRPDSDEWA